MKKADLHIRVQPEVNDRVKTAAKNWPTVTAWVTAAILEKLEREGK